MPEYLQLGGIATIQIEGSRCNVNFYRSGEALWCLNNNSYALNATEDWDDTCAQLRDVVEGRYATMPGISSFNYNVNEATIGQLPSVLAATIIYTT